MMESYRQQIGVRSLFPALIRVHNKILCRQETVQPEVPVGETLGIQRPAPMMSASRISGSSFAPRRELWYGLYSVSARLPKIPVPPEF